MVIRSSIDGALFRVVAAVVASVFGSSLRFSTFDFSSSTVFSTDRKSSSGFFGFALSSFTVAAVWDFGSGFGSGLGSAFGFGSGFGAGFG